MSYFLQYWVSNKLQLLCILIQKLFHQIEQELYKVKKKSCDFCVFHKNNSIDQNSVLDQGVKLILVNGPHTLKLVLCIEPIHKEQVSCPQRGSNLQTSEDKLDFLIIMSLSMASTPIVSAQI